MQSLARKNEWPLDKMTLTVDVTKKFKEEFNQPAREGAYIYGLYMEGIYTTKNITVNNNGGFNHNLKCQRPNNCSCTLEHQL